MSTTSPYAEQSRPADHEYRPNILGRILATLAVVWGAICICAGIDMGINSKNVFDFLNMAFFGLAFIVPATWWFICSAKDKKAFEAYAEAVKTREATAQFLTDEDAIILRGMGKLDPPARTPRRWWIIALITFGLLVISALTTPADKDEESADTPSTSSTSSTSATSSTNTTAPAEPAQP